MERIRYNKRKGYFLIMKPKIEFTIGEIVWYSYIESINNTNKNGIKLLSEKGKELNFTLPKSGQYMGDFDNGKKRKPMIIDGAETHTKKVIGKTFRQALKLLVEKLDRKDKKNGDNVLITKLTEMFPKSPYYNEHPEWFV